MKVQEVILEDNSRRYMLLDDEGFPVLPVMKYLKYLDTTGRSSNTQKTYCYALKQYFVYLQEKKKDHKNISLEDLVDFVAWLRNPYENAKVTPLQPMKSKKTEDSESYNQNDITQKLMKQVFTGGRTRYKDFLYHVNKGRPSKHLSYSKKWRVYLGTRLFRVKGQIVE